MPVSVVNAGRHSYSGSYAGPLIRATLSSPLILNSFINPHSAIRNPQSPRPRFAVREFVTLERFRFHCDAVARSERRHVTPPSHNHRVNEMLVQVIYEFNATIFKLAAHGYVIED